MMSGVDVMLDGWVVDSEAVAMAYEMKARRAHREAADIWRGASAAAAGEARKYGARADALRADVAAIYAKHGA